MTIPNEQFVHLHLHTEYSLLDGACRINKLMQKVKALGQKAVAITDHGVMYGTVDFFRAAKKEGIKPIIGCEVYVAPRTRFDRVFRVDSSPYHLILLCKNETGYSNLIKLVSAGFIEGFYNKPRIDRELLERYHEGLIVLSACLAGEIPQALLSGGYERAVEAAAWYKKLFGDDYYIELQDHGIEEQRRILPDLIRLSRELSIPLVATNDAHYIEKEDAQMQKVLICIQTNHTINDDDAMEFQTDNFYVRSTQEMAELFPMVPDAITNTAAVAEKCSFEFTFGHTLLPYFDTPNNMEHTEYLHKLCYEGLAKRYPAPLADEVRERAEYELSVINNMGFTDYFLIVYDYVNYAKTHDIPVGPGRGSGAGSIVAYSLGITNLDPIKYNLLFERFLNPERVSMPDFDVDFCYEKRQLVIDYVIAKYGKEHVAQIITFGTLAARAAIRDVARAMGATYSQGDVIAKLIPRDLGMTISKALRVSKELKALYDSDPVSRSILDMSERVEGMPRHAGTHAAGVVITPQPVSEYVALQKNEESIVTQFPMNTVGDLGLLKMDFLGLKTLTVISDAVADIRKRQPDFDIDSIPQDDGETFEILSKGDTDGVFQLESTGMRDLLKGMKPNSIEDLIAAVSLYRPGPMDSIPKYLANRSSPSKIAYAHPKLQNILSVTSGVIIYQEQVMEIFRELGGFSFGEADVVRRAMSKKKHDVMEREGARFVEACVKDGLLRKTAQTLYDDMASFADYAFNKSHAAGYALVAYQTAYLRRHYPAEFMAALLTSEIQNTSKITAYIAASQRLGIKILPPDVNVCSHRFTADEGTIRVGLLAVKSVGRGFISSLVAEREVSGRYKSFLDFCRRISKYDGNKRAIENLIAAGALDCFGHSRRTMLMGLESVLKSITDDKKKNLEGQYDLFSLDEDAPPEDANVPELEEFSADELLRMEKDITGIYISGHPLNAYAERISEISKLQIKDIDSEDNQSLDNTTLDLLCHIVSIKKRITKSNDMMAICTVEDLTGSLELMVFPKKYEELGAQLRENTVVVINARVSLKEDEAPKLLLNAVYNPEEFKVDGEDPAKKSKKATPPRKVEKLYIRVSSRNSPVFSRIFAVLELFEGESDVYVYCADTKKQIFAGENRRVLVCGTLIKGLVDVVGESNVVVK